MVITITQKIRFLLIRSVISIIWSFDFLSYIFFGRKFVKIFSYSLIILLMISLILYLPSIAGIKKEINLFYSGLNLLVYGPTDIKINPSVINNQNVMGTASLRTYIPTLQKKSAFPYITAKAHLIIDNNSKTILSEHNIYRTFAPASTTKLMTALIALDIYSLNEEISVLPSCLEIDSTKIWLPVNKKFVVKDILYSLLIGSAADSACMLANSKISEEDFVKLMNEKAKKIGMKDTFFTNSVGLDGENGSHFSSVWDLYLLSKEAMKNESVREAVKTKNYLFSPVNEKLTLEVENTNKLLWEIPESIGIKTGRTSGAGEVLIYEYKKENKDITVIVMSSDDRFLDTKNLLLWTLDSFEWR